MHDTSRFRVGHACCDGESFGFQSTSALCIAGNVIRSLLHRLKSLLSTRKRAWSNWVRALRGQRRGERATSGSQARVAPLGALDRKEEGVDPATPSSREMRALLEYASCTSGQWGKPEGTILLRVCLRLARDCQATSNVSGRLWALILTPCTVLPVVMSTPR
jgi:hypothetical protein